MKKLMNTPEDYTDDMLRGIYAAHGGQVYHAGDNLRCYCAVHRTPGKVAIVTGGGTGHLPLFLGYVGEGLLDGCAVGSVFQSPSAECIFEISKEVDTGAGILYLFGNYTGDNMNFSMAGELCELEGIQTKLLVGSDDVTSATPDRADYRRGVAGIFFLYKCAGACAAGMGTLDEVLAAAQLAKDNTRSVGFAFSPCVLPEVGRPNFTLAEGQMAMGMGIHGEPGVWNGPVKCASELAGECVETILADMPVAAGEEVAVLVNGLGATSQEELYIFSGCVHEVLREKGIAVYRTYVGEYATSMEMAGASVSLCRLQNREMKGWLDAPACTPFFVQN